MKLSDTVFKIPFSSASSSVITVGVVAKPSYNQNVRSKLISTSKTNFFTSTLLVCEDDNRRFCSVFRKYFSLNVPKAILSLELSEAERLLCL